MTKLTLLLLAAGICAAQPALAEGPGDDVPPAMPSPSLEAPTRSPTEQRLNLAPETTLSCTACKVVGYSGGAVFAAGYGAMVAGFVALNIQAYSPEAAASNNTFLPPEFITFLCMPMLVPVVGPLLEAGILEEPSMTKLFYADAGLQAAGLAVALLGATLDSRYGVSVVPTAGPGSAGMVASMRF